MYKIIIWGAGTTGQYLFDILHFDHDILMFIDISPELQGKMKMGKPIVAPQEALKCNFDYIIIANIYGQEIYPILNTYNIAKEKILNFVDNPVFDSLFEQYPDLRLDTLSTLSTIITNRNLSGAVAELGVYKGDFAKYINLAFPNKTFYLFDTFSGFDPRDIQSESHFSNAKENDYKNEDIVIVLNKMKYSEKCIIKAGYFPESSQGLEEEFCFVNLDADLYTPILNGLEYFYPRLVQGGYILVHDYTNPIFTGVKQAVHEYCFANNVPFTSINVCGCALILK